MSKMKIGERKGGKGKGKGDRNRSEKERVTVPGKEGKKEYGGKHKSWG